LGGIRGSAKYESEQKANQSFHGSHFLEDEEIQRSVYPWRKIQENSMTVNNAGEGPPGQITKLTAAN
jgi:hypothetical protein